MEGEAARVSHNFSPYPALLHGERHTGPVRRAQLGCLGPKHIQLEISHIKLDVAPLEGVGLTWRYGALPWPVQEKHGHKDDPLEAIAFVVVLLVECREGVMY